MSVSAVGAAEQMFAMSSITFSGFSYGFTLIICFFGTGLEEENFVFLVIAMEKWDIWVCFKSSV